MNIIDIQDNLKNLPEQALMQEMQRPTGSAPQFLVLGELKRRKQMRDDYNRQQNADMKTVAEEVVTAAGAPQEGIMQMARSLNPNTNMAQDTGLAQATPVTPTQAPQPQAPQMMSDGGIMRLQTGGYPDDLSKSVGSALSYNVSNQGRGVNTPNANVIDAYLRGELDPSSKVYRDMVTFEQLNGRDTLREISSQIVNPFGQSPSYSSRDEITPRMSQENAIATRRRLAGGAGIGSVSADVEDFAATPSYERGTGRATMIDGTFVEVMPDGNVFDARTGEMVAGDLAQAAIAKLTPDLTADNAAFAEAQGMPSVYNPEATMPSQADLDLRAQEVPTPDVFPNDISSFDAAAAYNAEQAQRQADLMATNENPTENFTFTGDVLPYLGRVASAVGSQIVEDTATEVLPVGSVPTPEEKIAAEVASLNAQIAAAGDDEVLIDLLNRRKNGLVRRLQVAEAQTDTGEFLSNIPATIDRGFQKYIAPGLGLTTPQEAAARINAIDASSADATASERAREAEIKALVGGATTVPSANVIDQESLLPMDTGEPLTVPSAEEGGIGSLLPPKAAPKTTTPVATKDTGGAGFGSMDSRIAQMLSNRQKEAESDKWMALAQTGMALMASKNPTFGGALGEAGLAGIGALQKSKQGARAFETDMLKLQTQLDIARQRARSSKSSKNIPATALTNAYTMVTDAQERLNNARSPAEKFSASQDLEAAQGRFLQIQTIFDSQFGVLPTAAVGNKRKQV